VYRHGTAPATIRGYITENRTALGSLYAGRVRRRLLQQGGPTSLLGLLLSVDQVSMSTKLWEAASKSHCSSSWVWGKPNNIEYSTNMLDCAKSLAHNPEHSTDEFILPLVGLQQTGVDFHEVLRVGCGREHDIPAIDLSFDPLGLFRQKIEAVKSSLPPSLSQNGKEIEPAKFVEGAADIFDSRDRIGSPFHWGTCP
jgi:hypothetical protein